MDNENKLSGVFGVSTYDSNLLRDVVHHMKYKFIKELADDLSLLAAQGLWNAHLSVPDIVIPVPLHSRRLRWRGFNQAEILARSLGLDVPIEATVLTRNRFTTSQVSMRTRMHRINNLKGAFTAQHTNNIKNKSVLLIDDVITTGATLNECAKVLLESGAKDVSALVIARD